MHGIKNIEKLFISLYHIYFKLIFIFYNTPLVNGLCRRDYCALKILKILSICLAITTITVGCTLKVHEVDIQSVSFYKFTGESAGLKVSADLFTDKVELSKFFGVDLISKGILPVFIILENQTSEDGFLLIKERCKLMLKTSNPENEKDYVYHNVQPSQPMLNYTSLNGIYPFLLVLSPISPTILLVGVYASIYQENIDIVVRNLEEKYLTDKIVYPGSSHHGFIYFKIDKKEYIANIVGISLEAQNIRTKEIITIMAVTK